MTRHGFRYAEGTCQGTCRWPKGGTVRRRTAPAARRCASGCNWRMPLRPDRPSLSQGLSTNARARTHGGAGGRLLLLRQAVLLDRLCGCGRSCFSSGGGWLKVGWPPCDPPTRGTGGPCQGGCARDARRLRLPAGAAVCLRAMSRPGPAGRPPGPGVHAHLPGRAAATRERGMLRGGDIGFRDVTP